MKTSKDTKQPPFKRGEWVRIFNEYVPVLRMELVGEIWWAKTASTELPAKMFRRSTAKQLRAESKRLAKRAAELSAAADAVEAKKKRK